MPSSLEYDLFGPWIDDVTDPDLVPRLYRDHPIDFERTELVLKVPRDIARRDATPDMDLYDALIVVDPHALTLLTRSESGFTTQVVDFTQVVALEDSAAHLDGRFRVHLRDATPFEFRYNSADSRRTERLVAVVSGLVRALRTPAASLSQRAASAVGESNRPHPDGEEAARSARTRLEADLDGRRDTGLIADFEKAARADDGLRLLAAHPTVRVPPRSEAGVLTGVVHRVRPMFLQGALYARSHGELHAFHRRDWLIRGDRSNLSRARLIVFPTAGLAAGVTPHPDYAADTITAGVGRAEISLTVPQAWPGREAVLRLLRESVHS